MWAIPPLTPFKGLQQESHTKVYVRVHRKSCAHGSCVAIQAAIQACTFAKLNLLSSLIISFTDTSCSPSFIHSLAFESHRQTVTSSAAVRQTWIYSSVTLDLTSLRPSSLFSKIRWSYLFHRVVVKIQWNNLGKIPIYSINAYWASTLC